MKMEQLGITSKMIRAAETLFLAMTLEQTIRPVVEAYEKEIMERSYRAPILNGPSVRN